MSKNEEAFGKAINAYSDIYEELKYYDSVVGVIKGKDDCRILRSAFDLLLQGILLNVAVVSDPPMPGPLAVGEHIVSTADIALYMTGKMDVKVSWKEIDSMGRSGMRRFVDRVNDELDSLADGFLYLFAENFDRKDNREFLKKMCDGIIDICIEAGSVSGGLTNEHAEVIDERLTNLFVDRFPVIEKIAANNK